VDVPNAQLVSGAQAQQVLSCPAGKKVLGGGGAVFGAAGAWLMNSSGPISDTQWGVSFANISPGTISATRVRFTAVCATVAP
jgi:hypothetical protein